MNETYYLFGVLIVASGFATYWTVTAPVPFKPEHKAGRVSYIYDGDTIHIKGLKPRVRLWGVDAPERGQKGAQFATDTLKKLTKGKKVTYIKMDTDKYNRIVARVFLPNVQEVNRLIIELEAAKEYCRYSKGFYGNC